jgi:transposase
MRGDERIQDGKFSYVSLEQRVPQDHPLRAVRKLTDRVLRTLSREFDVLYADSGRPSIAPEYILRALLLQVFYSVRSERLLVEQIDYKLRELEKVDWLFVFSCAAHNVIRLPRLMAQPQGTFREQCA